MDRIVRIFVVSVSGARQAFAFDITRFVSYNVDTRELVLDGVSVVVHADSADRLVRAYREWFMGGCGYACEG